MTEQKKNIDFLYVQLPFKIQNDKVMPPGAQEFGNDNADVLVGMMRNAKIPVMDIRSHIEENNWLHNRIYRRYDYQYERIFL